MDGGGIVTVSLKDGEPLVELTKSVKSKIRPRKQVAEEGVLS